MSEISQIMGLQKRIAAFNISIMSDMMSLLEDMRESRSKEEFALEIVGGPDSVACRFFLMLQDLAKKTPKMIKEVAELPEAIALLDNYSDGGSDNNNLRPKKENLLLEGFDTSSLISDAKKDMAIMDEQINIYFGFNNLTEY